MQTVTPFLMFQKDGKEAIEFYCQLFKDAKLVELQADPESGQLYRAHFTLGGQTFYAMDGGEHAGFVFSEGMSLFVACKDQEEIDYYWDAFIAAGGEAGQCGWLKDKYGMSWQIVPENIGEYVGNPAGLEALFKMNKIIVADLRAATVAK